MATNRKKVRVPDKFYEVITSTWLTENMGPTLGVVAVDTGNGTWKCYIGNCYGTPFATQTADEQKIAAFGAKITQKAVACGFFPHLDPEKFIT